MNNDGINFEEINAAVFDLYPDILKQWLPDGDIQGNEFVALNPLRTDSNHGSFKINILSGKWSDFAFPHIKGTDPISLYAYLNMLGQSEAALELKNSLSINGGSNRIFKNKTIKVEDDFVPIFPIPKTASRPNLLKLHWTYHYPDGGILGYVCRFTPHGQRKKYYVLLYGKTGNTYEWRKTKFPSPSPLYNLHNIFNEENKDKPILIVEGEKAADRAQELFPEYVVTTWPGGINAVEKAHWDTLANKDILLWPDNDPQGQSEQAMIVVSDLLSQIAKSITLLKIPKSYPPKWDLGDALDWDSEQARKALASFEKVAITVEKEKKPVIQSKTKVNVNTDHTPIPVPLLATLEEEFNNRLNRYNPAITQQAILSIASHIAARKAFSTNGDPASLYSAIVTQDVAGVTRYNGLIEALTDSIGIKRTVRSQRLTTAIMLHRKLYACPVLLYLAHDYGQMVAFAARQPSGAQEHALSQLAYFYNSTNFYTTNVELGFKQTEGAIEEEVTIYAPTINVFAILSYAELPTIMKATEVGRGNLSLYQLIFTDDSCTIDNTVDSTYSPFPNELIEAIKGMLSGDIKSSLAEMLEGQARLKPKYKIVNTSICNEKIRRELKKLDLTNHKIMKTVVQQSSDIIRRTAIVLAYWLDKDNPIITEEILNWCINREQVRLLKLNENLDKFNSESGKIGNYQKVLEIITNAKSEGVTATEIVRNCWAFRNLDNTKREDLLTMLVTDDAVSLKPPRANWNGRGKKPQGVYVAVQYDPDR